MWLDVEFRVRLPKTNLDLAKLYIQWKTHGNVQKQPPIDINSNFYFPKNLSINLNQNSTKDIKREGEDFVMRNKKNTHTHNPKTYIFFKKPSILIRVLRKNKNSPREREYSQFFFFVVKIWIEMGEMISNL